MSFNTINQSSTQNEDCRRLLKALSQIEVARRGKQTRCLFKRCSCHSSLLGAEHQRRQRPAQLLAYPVRERMCDGELHVTNRAWTGEWDIGSWSQRAFSICDAVAQSHIEFLSSLNSLQLTSLLGNLDLFTLLHFQVRTENFFPLHREEDMESMWRCIHTMWIYSFLTVLLALPGAIGGILTLTERYNKWRSDHAKKER